MKRQIRRCTFETNSSSTHSICISKEPVDTVGRTVDFHIGEYGWANDTCDAADYLYTAILCSDNREELLEKFTEILDKNGVEYTMEEPVYGGWTKDDGTEYRYLDNGYIDHDDQTQEFLDAVFSDEGLLLRCVLGDSVVYTGNDNDDYRLGDYGQNETKYDYFYKGN